MHAAVARRPHPVHAFIFHRAGHRGPPGDPQGIARQGIPGDPWGEAGVNSRTRAAETKQRQIRAFSNQVDQAWFQGQPPHLTLNANTLAPVPAAATSPARGFPWGCLRGSHWGIRHGDHPQGFPPGSHTGISTGTPLGFPQGATRAGSLKIIHLGRFIRGIPEWDSPGWGGGPGGPLRDP